MEQYPEQVNARDDQYLERIALLNQLGDHRKAYDLLMARKFHPWEGGEGKVTGQYRTALAGLGRMEEATDAWIAAATGELEISPPWFYNDQPPEKLYFKGLALLKLGREPEARGCFNRLNRLFCEHLIRLGRTGLAT